MEDRSICYLDGEEITLSEKQNVTINCGHHVMTINKLFGPMCIEPIKICVEGEDWNVNNIIKRLRAENRGLKSLKETLSARFWREESIRLNKELANTRKEILEKVLSMAVWGIHNEEREKVVEVRLIEALKENSK